MCKERALSVSRSGHRDRLPREQPTPSAGDVWDGAVAPSSLPQGALPQAAPQGARRKQTSDGKSKKSS